MCNDLFFFCVPIASEIQQLSVRNPWWELEIKSLIVFTKYAIPSSNPDVHQLEQIKIWFNHIILVPPNWASDMSSSGGKTGWGSDEKKEMKDDFDDWYAVQLHFLWSNSSNVIPILKYNSPKTNIPENIWNHYESVS